MTDWIKSKAHFSSLLSIFAVGACSHGLWQGWWIATACLVVLTHHKNITRLLHGNESKVPLFKKRKGREK